MKKITIHNSLEHILVYGYFEHSFDVYLHYLKPKEVPSIQVVEMKGVFENIRMKLRNNSYLAPNILNQNNLTTYPFQPKFTDEEIFWFKKIMEIKFTVLFKKTRTFFRIKKRKKINNIYLELYSNLRTDAAIEYLRSEFLGKN